MPTVVDTLVTRYALDTKEYDAGASRVLGTTKGLSNATGLLSTGLMALATGATVAAAALVGVAAGLTKLAQEGSQAHATMEAAKMGLRAYAKDGKDAEEQLKRLREVAKAPGLGLLEAIKGSTRLQAVGFSAQMAERALAATGNAIALVGGGKAELDGVTLALTQIAAKGKVSAEEINQLQERMPQIRQAMKDAFGTSDTEALGKMGVTAEVFVPTIVAALERLPKATTGAKNAFENLGDAGFMALASIGEAVNKRAVPTLQTLSGWLDFIESKGVLKNMAETFAGIFDGGSKQGFLTVLAYTTAFLEQSVIVIRIMSDEFKKYVGMLGKAMDAMSHLPGMAPLKAAGVGLQVIANATGGAAFMGDVDARARQLMSGYQEDQNMARFRAHMALGSSAPAPDAASPATMYLAEIAQNTRRAVDLHRMALGGGDIGRFGVTPTELSGMRRHRRHASPARAVAIGMMELGFVGR